MDLSILNKELIKKMAMTIIKSPHFWAKFIGAIIPICFLVYVLFLNFTPFGYSKTYKLSIGAENDTDTSELYLLPSKDFSERKKTPNGNSYRELNGIAKVVFDPIATLTNAKVDIQTTDQGITIIPPKIDFDHDLIHWDQTWDFTKGIPSIFSTTTVFHFDDGAYFDGKSRLEQPNTSQDFEDGPFSIYVEWKPENPNGDFQEIIGHFNWELVQNSNSVSFQIGRMDNASGTTRTIKYPVKDDFFQKKHTAIVVYQPTKTENGFVDLFVDGFFGGRVYIQNEEIWKEYGKNNLSFGWTPHNYGKSPYFQGSIYYASYAKSNVIGNTRRATINTQGGNAIYFTIASQATSTVSNLKLKVESE